MQKKYACVRYLHTRITLYHACKIDLRYCKALHSCITCKLLHQVGLPCAAIHYGICTAVAVPQSSKTPPTKTPSNKIPPNKASPTPPQPSSTPAPAPVSVTKKPVQPPVVVVNSNDVGPSRSAASSGTSGGGVGKPVTHSVGVRTPVSVVVSKPSAVSSKPGPGFSLSELDGDVEVLPAFPVSPEDKVNTSAQHECRPSMELALVCSVYSVPLHVCGH
ncbi:hypothetical protein BaRGS_00009538 [Batillaria attramentaria]|uniref:Uncharacterized protein n=1 Tax=Batillaria attramentaria TaxID=370345 RepID=A0ABD0LJJ2_9CAEN